jgi:hypothetical protein
MCRRLFSFCRARDLEPWRTASTRTGRHLALEVWFVWHPESSWQSSLASVRGRRPSGTRGRGGDRVVFIAAPLRRVVVRQMEPAAEGVQRRHPEAQLPSNRTLADPLRSGVPAGGSSGFSARPRTARTRAAVPALLRGRLVANFALAQPAVYVNLQQLRAEAKDPTPGKKDGSQEGFEAIFTLKIKRGPRDGRPGDRRRRGAPRPARRQPDQSPRRQHPERPVQGTDVPSDLRLDAVVFENGGVTLDGHADFLAGRSRAFDQTRGKLGVTR